ncbi:MAG: hypothetical protein COS65_04875 [Armatimonadetes bacterium CG06_land_8_20_14_3_00_66_21]|nr:MAG: hypothetical protein COS65_04875 [Armatimonadetes bacterium CG06_land_8_20_14_3_00_66_21]
MAQSGRLPPLADEAPAVRRAPRDRSRRHWSARWPVPSRRRSTPPSRRRTASSRGRSRRTPERPCG